MKRGPTKTVLAVDPASLTRLCRSFYALALTFDACLDNNNAPRRCPERSAVRKAYLELSRWGSVPEAPKNKGRAGN